MDMRGATTGITMQGATSGVTMQGFVDTSELVRFAIAITGSIDPVITASGLADGDILWTKPLSGSFTGKAPSGANFDVVGEYCFTATDLSEITQFDCRTDNVSGLDVAALTALTYLHCGDNGISVLDVADLTSLNYLYCNSNSLSVLDVAALTSLFRLYCNSNTISELDVADLTSLVYLHCGSNDISELDVSALTSLVYLSCYSNSIPELDVSALTSLTYLSCHNNNMSQSAVDDILVDLDNAGASGGTCNIDGTNAAPSATGLAAKTSLEGRGWTVTVST